MPRYSRLPLGWVSMTAWIISSCASLMATETARASRNFTTSLALPAVLPMVFARSWNTSFWPTRAPDTAPPLPAMAESARSTSASKSFSPLSAASLIFSMASAAFFRPLRKPSDFPTPSAASRQVTSRKAFANSLLASSMRPFSSKEVPNA